MTDTLDTPLAIAVQPGAPDGAHIMPSGNWVVLGDGKDISRGEKKAMVRAAAELNAIDSGYYVTEALLTRLVTAWSYPFPIPAEDASALDQLPGQDDQPLMDLMEPARLLIFPKRPDPSDHKDPTSPTEASGE